MKLLSFNTQEVKSTLTLALPIVVGNLSGMLMGWVDTLMVGRLGVVPLAAAAFANTIWVFFYVLGTGCVLSISIRAAEAHGAQDISALKRWLSACLVIVLVVGTLTTAASLGLIKLLPLLGQQPEVLHTCMGFYICIVLSLTPSLLWLGLKAFLDALGRPWIGFWVQICAVGINVVLNWLLIFGNWGFPKWGITGAGVATLIARILGAVAMVVIFLSIPHLRNFLLCISDLSWKAVRNLIRLGIPISSQMLSEVIAFNLGAIMIGWLGAVPLAAHQIALTIAITVYVIPMGVGTALIIRTGNLLGAGEVKRLQGTVYGTVVVTCIFMGCLGAGVILLSNQIPKWFVDSSDVHHITTQLLIILGILQIPDALYVLAQSQLRGLSDVRFPTLVNICAYLGFGLVCAYVLGCVLQLHAQGVWIGLFLGTALSGFLCSLRLRRKISYIVGNASS